MDLEEANSAGRWVKLTQFPQFVPSPNSRKLEQWIHAKFWSRGENDAYYKHAITSQESPVSLTHR